MTLTISPEVEEKIVAQARERGLSADEYAAEILERSVASIGTTARIEPAVSAKEYLRRGPLQPNVAAGWPGEVDEDAHAGSSRNYLLPSHRPTAEEVAADLQALAGTDRPAKEYPPDFFSREVIYADHD